MSAIEQRGLKASVIKQESDTVESGCVIDQNPKDGEMVELGSTVVISVAAESSGSSSGSAESTHSGDSESETEPAPTEATEEEQTEAQTEAQTEKPNSGDISTYILPESSDRYLDYPDLEGVDGFDLVLARNEIYARHGRLFDSQEVQDYFNRCTWYNGTISPEDFDESVLNSYERANVDFILQKEYSTME